MGCVFGKIRKKSGVREVGREKCATCPQNELIVAPCWDPFGTHFAMIELRKLSYRLHLVHFL